jgi:hypothetical protein
MEFEGVVRNGMIVPDDLSELPKYGTRVRITLISHTPPEPFGKGYARVVGAAECLPEDMAALHDHYRLGTPNR